jgi:hypothetical protein
MQFVRFAVTRVMVLACCTFLVHLGLSDCRAFFCRDSRQNSYLADAENGGAHPGEGDSARPLYKDMSVVTALMHQLEAEAQDIPQVCSVLYCFVFGGGGRGFRRTMLCTEKP